jgi:ribulose-bisphosphate carboxylase large chain
VEYGLQGSEEQARRIAELLCLDQTIEAPAELLAEYPESRRLIGHIEDFHPCDHGASAAISFPVDLFGSSCTQFLHTLFGTASLKPGIQVKEVHLPETLPDGWSGPRYGLTGVRVLVDVPRRPLVCGVLKPVGASPQDLANLAYQFALGGLDLVKDDQGLSDHVWCPFDERLKRVGDSLARAANETGRPCLYFPHVSGPWEVLHERASQAQRSGAGGLLASPGLTGFEAFHDLANDDAIALPLFWHPSFLGTYYVNQQQGLAPAVLFGRIPRLLGADLSISPTFGLEFPLNPEDCRLVSTACRDRWGILKPIFPTAAGRMEYSRIQEMIEVYGRDLCFILGSQVRISPDGIRPACERFVREVHRLA